MEFKQNLRGYFLWGYFFNESISSGTKIQSGNSNRTSIGKAERAIVLKKLMNQQSESSVNDSVQAYSGLVRPGPQRRLFQTLKSLVSHSALTKSDENPHHQTPRKIARSLGYLCGLSKLFTQKLSPQAQRCGPVLIIYGPTAN